MSKNNKSGFTIIEVSLVLAIAGLIFLMVFVALPALQRNQRDAKRKDDILLFLEATKKYQSNNRGALPSDSSWENVTRYISGDFKDPSGNNYILSVKDCGSNSGANCKNLPSLESMDYTLHIFKQATCNGEKAVGTSNPKNIAVMYRLEGSGVYCANT